MEVIYNYIKNLFRDDVLVRDVYIDYWQFLNIHFIRWGLDFLKFCVQTSLDKHFEYNKNYDRAYGQIVQKTVDINDKCNIECGMTHSSQITFSTQNNSKSATLNKLKGKKIENQDLESYGEFFKKENTNLEN
eukprot:CAMPEP_0116994496 /NCGR_PEP_ID=MMETSP0467-20121206/68165_1 /TAXON_ID=283647 /ORGANISM="Mesodinium pulex, Strain SPMC105" /LENGTH=131 /DNA_ID=CAMNT_0004692575 /DNA_START=239 /DNA_END=634 /DNA_ORIENTATION=-